MTAYENITTLLDRIEEVSKTGDDYHITSEDVEQLQEAQERVKKLGIANVVKSLPNDEKVKAHIDTLPYYGTCTTEYNEGFEDGVKWLKEQLAK